MTLPAILFGLMLAVLLGVLFHILRGGEGWRLLFHIGLSVAGFALGELASLGSGWSLYKFGALDVGMGAFGSASVLAFGDWLTRIETQN